MSNNTYTDLQFTQISPEVHLLPGLGNIEYLYTAKPRHLTININGTEVKVIEGDEAKQTYFQILGMNEDTDPLEAQLNIACIKAWNTTLAALKDKTRQPEVKDLRQILMWHMRKTTAKSFREIGLYFGNYDHATAMHAHKRIEAMKDTDAVIKHHLNLFEIAIKSF